MKRTTVLAAALAVLAFATCGDDTGPIDRLRSEGSVSELGTGAPIENALLLLGFPAGSGIGSRSAVTNAQGQYAITFVAAFPFTDCRGFFLTVDADGYESVTEDEIQCIPEQTIDFELRAE